jgi:hypothetical protein
MRMSIQNASGSVDTGPGQGTRVTIALCTRLRSQRQTEAAFAAVAEGCYMPGHRSRNERLQVMLTAEELKLIDDFWFDNRLPTRAAAVRELFRRGLAAAEFPSGPEGGKPTPIHRKQRRNQTS